MHCLSATSLDQIKSCSEAQASHDFIERKTCKGTSVFECYPVVHSSSLLVHSANRHSSALYRQSFCFPLSHESAHRKYEARSANRGKEKGRQSRGGSNQQPECSNGGNGVQDSLILRHQSPRIDLSMPLCVLGLTRIKSGREERSCLRAASVCNGCRHVSITTLTKLLPLLLMMVAVQTI